MTFTSSTYRAHCRFWKTPGVFTADTAVGRAEDIWHALQWGAYAIVRTLTIMYE